MFKIRLSDPTVSFFFVAAVLALLLGIAAEIPGFPLPQSDHFLLSIIVILIGVLCGGLGFERWELMQRLSKASGRFRRMDTRGEVYAGAKSLVNDCGQGCCIQSTDLYPANKTDDRTFKEYIESMANRLKQVQARHHILVGSDQAEFGKRGLETRLEIMRRCQVPEARIESQFFHSTFPMEMIITDKSVLFAFPNRDGSIEMGFVLDDDQLARRLSDWYSFVLWKHPQGGGAGH
jgi:hypothetical protein